MNEHDDLLEKVEKAKEQIAQLRKQESELEREKAALEELKNKQEEWYRGKKEVGAALLRAIAILDGEDADLNRMIALARTYRETFTGLLEALNAVKEDRWTSATLREELNKVLLIIQKGRRELGAAKTRIPALEAKEGPAGVSGEPAEMSEARMRNLSAPELVRIGFWLALPAAVMAIAVALIIARL
ncbi:MAG: hypothetical protein NT045_06840 [Candidatus Aureabacteria bacterium]|nr:hypothetical protein [Candidatus Auribacterota bacterium]